MLYNRQCMGNCVIYTYSERFRRTDERLRIDTNVITVYSYQLGSPNSASQLKSKTWIVIGAVEAAVLVIMTLILIVACFLYRQTIHIYLES